MTTEVLKVILVQDLVQHQVSISSFLLLFIQEAGMFLVFHLHGRKRFVSSRVLTFFHGEPVMTQTHGVTGLMCLSILSLKLMAILKTQTFSASLCQALPVMTLSRSDLSIMITTTCGALMM